MSPRDVRRAVIGGASDVGTVRHENEDSFGVWGLEAGDWDFLVAVADGVGGHEHGKQASELALSALLGSLTAQPLPHNDEGLRWALHTAVADANREVYYAFPGTSAARPGSTLTCALCREGKCYVGHVGDSRAYMIRGGRVFQLSTDHTWVQSQVDRGAMTAEEAAASPYRNQVIKVLGAEPSVEPDVIVRPTAPGDLFIVCSDGVTEHVSVHRLLAEAVNATSADDLAKALVALAVAQGGSDNAIAVVAGVPFEHSAEARSAAPETSEIPLFKQPPGAQSTAATALTPPTVPLPSVLAQVRPRRDWRPVLAGGLVALFVLLGLMLINLYRHPNEPPPELEHGATAADQEDQDALQPSGDASGPSVAPAPSMDGPVVKLVRSISLPRVQHVAFSHDGSKVAILSRDGDPSYAEDWLLYCFTVMDGTKLFEVNYYIKAGSQVIFSPDDKRIYHQFCTDSLDREGPAAISATTGDTVWRARGKEHFTGGLAISPNGKHLAATDQDSIVGLEEGGAIYDATNGRMQKRLPKAHCGYGSSCSAPRGHILLRGLAATYGYYGPRTGARGTCWEIYQAGGS
jgi:serine/threonine protein phosphatase PrpC